MTWAHQCEEGQREASATLLMKQTRSPIGLKLTRAGEIGWPPRPREWPVSVPLGLQTYITSSSLFHFIRTACVWCGRRMEVRRQLSRQFSPSTVGSESGLGGKCFSTCWAILQASDWLIMWGWWIKWRSCVYSKCLTDWAISSVYHYNFLRDLTIPSNFTSPITAAMSVWGASVSLFML